MCALQHPRKAFASPTTLSPSAPCWPRSSNASTTTSTRPYPPPPPPKVSYQDHQTQLALAMKQEAARAELAQAISSARQKVTLLRRG